MKTEIPYKREFILALLMLFNLAVLWSQDTIPPVIKLNPGAPGCIELYCSNLPYVDPGATATDNQAPFNLTSSIVVTGTVNTHIQGVYTLTYTVQDAGGNIATAVRHVCVENTKDQGFHITPISGGYRLWTDWSMGGGSRYFYKWYLDGKFVREYDSVNPPMIDNLYFFPNDTKRHHVCMDRVFCYDDTAYRICRIFGDTVLSTISGRVYFDANNDCVYDTLESVISYVPIKLLDGAGKLVTARYSYKGDYSFDVDFGKYTVEIANAGLPITVNCDYPGKDTTVILDTLNLLAQDLDFAVSPSQDVGILFVTGGEYIKPGVDFYVSPVIGEMTSFYGFPRVSSIKGKVVITYEGKVAYKGINPNARYPDSISGKRLVFLVSDLGALNPGDFGLIFTADTSARNGDTLIINIDVIPEDPDANPANNRINGHYLVRTSYDPNMKEVFPVDVQPSYSGWLNYTIRFQNTGKAAASRVRVADTLDMNLDPSTFEIIGFSHIAQVSLKGRALVFNFPDIELPDSSSDEPGSHGYIQYRVKPLPNLAEGIRIYNTAYIFFDYNEPVVTNTTVNTFTTPKVGLNTVLPGVAFNIFPNPGSGLFSVVCNRLLEEGALVDIYDLYGNLVYTQAMKGRILEMNLGGLNNGFYICRLSSGRSVLYQTLIKQ